MVVEGPAKDSGIDETSTVPARNDTSEWHRKYLQGQLSRQGFIRKLERFVGALASEVQLSNLVDTLPTLREPF